MHFSSRASSGVSFSLPLIEGSLSSALAFDTVEKSLTIKLLKLFTGHLTSHMEVKAVVNQTRLGDGEDVGLRRIQ